MSGRTFFGAGFARGFSKAWLAAGYVFLYLPIVALVIFSFNDSPIPNVWAGFTLKWYAALPGDREMIGGLWLSLQIAFFTACGSVVLGTLAAFALVKYRKFSGRTLFNGMVSAPLVMPEVIIGLSLLLMLVFIPCIGEFVIPELLGGPQTLMIGRVLWDEFFANNDWPVAGAVAVVMVLLILLPMALLNRSQEAEAKEARR